MIDNDNQESEKDFDWSEMLQGWYFRGMVVFKRLWWVFLFTLSIGLGFQAYKEHQRQPNFISNARMIVDGRIALPDGAVYSEEVSNFFGTQIDLMMSSRVQNQARDRVAALHPEHRPCPVHISVSQADGASIFNLTASGLEKKYTQYYLDAVMFEYLNFKKERRSQTTESTFLSIMEKVLEYQQQIEDLEEQKVNFQKENNIIFLKEQGSQAGSYLAELNSKQASLKTELRLLEQINLGRASTPGGKVDDRGVFLEPVIKDKDDDYLNAKRVVDKLVAERDEFAIYMKSKHPKIIRLNREIERQQNLIRIYRKQTVQQLVERRLSLETELANLDEVISEWEEKALKYSSLLAEFERLGSRLENIKKLHDRLVASIESLDINLNIDQEMVSVLEPASPAYEPFRNAWWRELLTGAMLGLVAGAGILFAFAFLDTRLMSVEDITSRYDAPVLGVIPLQTEGSGKVDLLHENDERLFFAESCRNIRSSLLFMDSKGPPPQVILVTSSVPAEGKSTVAGNLAVTLGFASSKTLLIDADLRRGHLHTNLGMKNDIGLSELLQDESLSVEDVLHKTEVDDLDFIPRGDFPENPGELLLGDRFLTLLTKLRQHYDYIIIDSPPVLATDDTPSFANRADAVLFLVRSNFTRQRQVKTSLEIFKLRGIDVRGFILNFVSGREPGHYYYYKYYDYYSYRAKGKGKNKSKGDQAKKKA